MFFAKNKKILYVVVNIFFAILWGLFVYENFNSYLVSGSLSTLITTISETIMVFIFIFRKEPRMVSSKAFDWTIAFVASMIPTFFRPANDLVIWQTDFFSIIGGCFLVISYLSINRNFGIVPAIRDIESRGSYAIVRHPIYAGYLLTFIGYCINNASFENLAVLIFSVTTMLIRINAEEEFLMKDDFYNLYKNRVKWKLIPFLY